MSNYDELLKLAFEAHATGNFKKASSLYNYLLQKDPDCVAALGWLGVIEAQNKDYLKAKVLLERAILLDGKPEFFLNYANLLQEQNQYEEAISNYQKAIGLEPNIVALTNLAACQNNLEHYELALKTSNNALAMDNNYAPAWINLGNSLNQLKRYEEALVSYGRAIELKPNIPESWYNRGNTLKNTRLYEEALVSYGRAIELKPEYAEAWNNRGNALNDLRRHEEALASFEKSIALKPDYAEAWSNRGITLNEMKRHQEAVQSFSRALEIKPGKEFALSDLISAQIRVCDWVAFSPRRKILSDCILKSENSVRPFDSLRLFDSPHLQLLVAKTYFESKLKPTNVLGSIPNLSYGKKIRLGYFSMDFREHPVAYLMSGLIEYHNRKEFEVFGFSFGADTKDPIRKKLEKSFDEFFDVSLVSDIEISRLSRQLKIDIAIDLGGHTKDSRPAIFFERAAPVQVNYLGYPGTMGSSRYDYLIADTVLIPHENEMHYSENIVYLPYCYQVNNYLDICLNKNVSRQDCGLPETGFVFCCFNNSWKILPDLFDSWMRILNSVDQSVLWLLDTSEAASTNLRKEADARNIDPTRILFAQYVDHESHLSRYKLADLFLDTYPYGAHTTASDALWMGLPLLTLKGGSFASRVATSLLINIGAPELVTSSIDQYEARAIELASKPETLKAIRTKLNENRSKSPVFDTEFMTNKIEEAYQKIWDRHSRGLSPTHLYLK
jgi:predicted O-linked N-acetylglucosamine transferase (SPINDLY family)